MFGLFGRQAKGEELTPALQEMEEIKERFITFIGKLEEKLMEFADASIPELIELNNTDTDEYKRAYHRMKSAVLGQLDSIQKKALAVKEEKVTNFYLSHSSDHQLSKAYYDFRNECYNRYEQFDALTEKYRERVEQTRSEDYEKQYRQILDEYEAIKNKFRCVQCGSPITVDKIYFTTTYLTCPACQTSNTFDPGTRAKNLEQLGRSLAEQRTAHLLTEHDAIPARTQTLYLQRHQLQLSLIHEKDKQVIRDKTRQIEELGRMQEELENKRPALYQAYLRAMFDEWNQINPALKEEHERFYNRLLSDYRKYKL